jgi:molybdate transport system substrate-binding protein
MTTSMLARACFAGLLVAASCTATPAAEIKLMAANAAKEAVTTLAGEFEKASGHKVTLLWGGTEAITKRMTDGQAADIVLIAAPNIERLIALGKLSPGSRADFAKTGVGVAVRAGLPKPDVSSTDALKKAVLEAKSVAYSTGPSGFYIVELLKKLGISEQVKEKVKQPASGTQIAEMLARGDADLGFQQVSELVHAKGIDYVGPLPAEIQHVTIYALALTANAAAPEPAKTLIAFMTTAAAVEPIKKMGLEPPK